MSPDKQYLPDTYSESLACIIYRLCSETNHGWVNNLYYLVVYPPKIMDFVSWDDEIPNQMDSHSKFHGSSHHQADISLTIINHD